ncbi:Exocyst complex component 7 [Blattella germanica]|nr:Exocyst complex component 7 [Blattella germanica]
MKELNNLNLLKERVSRSSQLTKGMVGILSSFEHRLARLEETILPVYNETGNLQRKQESFYGVSQEVEPVVRAGPGPIANGGSGLDSFLQAMDKLQSAQEYFEKNNPQSVELENVVYTPVEETPASLNHFPESVSGELIRIADWLIMHNRDEYMNVYARVRATVLLKSLQQLKEQQRSSSGGSIQNVQAANSPMVRPKFPSRRASKRLHV